MRSDKNLKPLLASATGLAVLILDSKTAIDGARAGLEMCFHTVVPSLFPFIFLSSILAASLTSANIKWNKFFSHIFKIPTGAEGILLTGLLGGYPVGARCINEAVADKQLAYEDAQRMLVFCNAAGPAFIFGITGKLFHEPWIPWFLWGIHLFSALCMARILPAKSGNFILNKPNINQSITERLRQTVKVMGEICGWIILMRIVISFLEKWLLLRLTKPFQVFLTGMIELSNGCISLAEIRNAGLRFILCSVFLGFGGLCVTLQTHTTASSVNQHMYLPGKCFQALISFVVSYVLQFLLFPSDQKMKLPWLFGLSLGITLLIFINSLSKAKNSCGNYAHVGV